MYNKGDISTEKPISDLNYGNGPFIGYIKNNFDPSRNGRVLVSIPFMEQNGSVKEGHLFPCDYLSPYYGTKSDKATSPNKPYQFEASQHSYGMWMTPPDIDTRVLVIFADQDYTKAYWIGCIPEPYINQMIPGIGATDDTVLDLGGDFEDKVSVYGDSRVPAGEVNKKAWKDTKVPFDKAKKPVHTPMAETLRKQGLSRDRVRGTTTSSARRESPSRVFGISTPGRTKNNSKTFKLGPEDRQLDVKTERLSGHTFVMDDGDAAGDNQLVRIRSSSGHQLLFHDAPGGDQTKSLLYISHGSGDTWLEFGAGGVVDLYAKGSINVRADHDINFHSESNINFYAKKNIRARAKTGQISLDAQQMLQMAENDHRIQSNTGSVTLRSNQANILSYAGNTQLHMAGNKFHLTGAEVHFNSTKTNGGLVPTFSRTGVLSVNGTGTLTVKYPDVNSATKANGIFLKVQENSLEGMSGMRVPTHEPYKFHTNKVTAAATGTAPGDSKQVGSVGYLADVNRNSSNPIIQLAQFQADLDYKVKSLADTHGNDPIKIREIAKDFANTYSKDFKLSIDPLKQITAEAEGVNELIKQTIDSVSGSQVTLLKDLVFIDTGNLVFKEGELGAAITGLTKALSGDLSKGLSDITNVGNILGDVVIPDSITGLLPGLQAPGNVTDALNKTTDTLKSVIGGEITAVTEIKSIETKVNSTLASIGKAIGNIFKGW